MTELKNVVWAISTDREGEYQGNTDIAFGTAENGKPAIRIGENVLDGSGSGGGVSGAYMIPTSGGGGGAVSDLTGQIYSAKMSGWEDVEGDVQIYRINGDAGSGYGIQGLGLASKEDEGSGDHIATAYWILSDAQSELNNFFYLKTTDALYQMAEEAYGVTMDGEGWYKLEFSEETESLSATKLSALNITFTGGDDATNPTLIAYLKKHGTFYSGELKTSIPSSKGPVQHDLELDDTLTVENKKLKVVSAPTATTATTANKANGVSFLSTAPTSDNTDGDLKFVVLDSEPQTKYNGYMYIIKQAD